MSLNDAVLRSDGSDGQDMFELVLGGPSVELESEIESDQENTHTPPSCPWCCCECCRPNRGRLAWLVRMIRSPTWPFLCLLGCSVAVLAFGIDLVESKLHELRRLNSVLDGLPFIVQFIVYTTLALLLSLLAAACGKFISANGEGSGIPQMKSILSGANISEYLSLRTGIAKTVGLILGLAGGLSIGKEGPFVHLACICSAQLSHLPFFSRIQKSEHLRRQMLQAACAAGVACTFGAPVGGVLFSVEVISTYYMVSNLWKAFFCSVCAFLMFRLTHSTGLVALFQETTFDSFSNNGELVAFGFVGILSGLLGALFNHITQRTISLRTRYRIVATSRYGQVAVMALITALLTFPFRFMRSPLQHVINDMFGTGTLDDDDWDRYNIFFSLTYYVVAKFLLTAITITLPIPCGLFTPVFSVGAVLGRLAGEVLAVALPNSGIVPGAYAIVGAAAFSSGVTRTISTTVIVFELTGQLHHLLPILLAILFATAVGALFNLSIYDTLMIVKGLPFLPILPHQTRIPYTKTVSEYMRRNIRFFCKDFTYLEVKELLQRTPYQIYPVVDRRDSMMLVGTISRSFLRQMVATQEERFFQSHGMVAEDTSTQESWFRWMRRKMLRTTHSGHAFDALPMIPSKPTSPQTRDGTSESGGIEEFETAVLDSNGPGTDLAAPRSPSPDGCTRVENDFNDAMSVPVNLSYEGHPETIDLSPLQITETTPLKQVLLLFTMLPISHIYVHLCGRLVGVVTKRDLIATGHRMT